MKNPFLAPRVKKEAAVERYLKQQVERFGGIIRKATFPGHSGAPDRLLMFPGVLVWVELKTTRGIVSAVQEREHARFRSMGQRVDIIRTQAEVDHLVEELYALSQHV